MDDSDKNNKVIDELLEEIRKLHYEIEELRERSYTQSDKSKQLSILIESEKSTNKFFKLSVLGIFSIASLILVIFCYDTIAIRNNRAKPTIVLQDTILNISSKIDSLNVRLNSVKAPSLAK